MTTMSVFEHSDGMRTIFDITGDEPPLLLIHGAEGSRRSFDQLVPKFANRFTIITYDQRDCGETENPAQSAGLCQLANDATELLHGIGYGSAYVFGTSFGGRVAQAMALLHAPAVERLILVSTCALPLSLRDLNGEVAIAMARLRARLPNSAEELAKYFFPPAFLAPQPQFRQHFAKTSVRSARSDRRAEAVNEHPNLAVSNIRIKTLLLAGQCDRLVPPALTLGMKDDIQHAETAVLEGLGHIKYVQAPDELAHHLCRFFA
jgi:pimeloyl-ACP methyl ester carboxylesterase